MKPDVIREIVTKHLASLKGPTDEPDVIRWCLEKNVTEALRILEQAGFVPARCHTGFSPLGKGGEVSHVSWTAEGGALPADEKLAEEANILAAIEDARHDMVAINRVHLMNIYKALTGLVRLGQASAQEWIDMPKDLADLKHEIFRLADFPAMFAGQSLAKEDRESMLAALTQEGRG